MLPFLIICISRCLNRRLLKLNLVLSGALNSRYISDQDKKVLSCRPQAKIINRAVGEVCKCPRSARALSQQGLNTIFFPTGTTSLKKVKKRWLYS
jgi:hypothetical protein